MTASNPQDSFSFRQSSLFFNYTVETEYSFSSSNDLQKYTWVCNILGFFQKMTTHHVKVKILTCLLKKISITDDVGIKEGIELSILFLVPLRANCVV
jgi:hypothetical protein